MNEQKIVMLDLTDCKYLGELHQRIKKAFNFPNFYGEIEKMHNVLQDFKENCEKLGDSIDFEIMS